MVLRGKKKGEGSGAGVCKDRKTTKRKNEAHRQGKLNHHVG